ncbi:MAG: mannosyltransferase [Solirubrobacteraceae bacterium]|nr:mannosyltransferase [Solirubrobacteraceae bacterium]
METGTVPVPPRAAEVPVDRPAAPGGPVAGRVLWILGGITLLAALLRFATLDVQSLWLDESATLRLLRPGLWDTLSQLPGSESAPPLYYVLAWGWTRVLGTGAVDLRSLSAVFGTLTVPVAFLAARRASDRAGLWAAAIAAVNPLLFYYAQEARAYALLILLAGLSFVLWQRALDDPTPRRTAWWAAVSALALTTHYFALFLVIPEALWLVRRFGLRRLAVPLGGLAVVGLALAPLALRQREDGKSNWIEGTSLASRIAQAPKQFVAGIDGPAEIVTAALALLCIVAAVAVLVRRGTPRERETAFRAAVVAGVGLLLPLLLSLSGLADLFNGRNVVACWIPAATVAGVALGTRAAPRVTAALGIVLCAVSVFVVLGVLTDKGYQRDDWRGVADGVKAEPAADRIIVTPQNGGSPLALYLPGADWRQRPSGSFTTAEVDVVTLRTRRTGRASLPPVPATQAPPGFTLAGTRTTDSYAIARFVAPRPVALTARQLQAPVGEPGDLLIQRR